MSNFSKIFNTKLSEIFLVFKSILLVEYLIWNVCVSFFLNRSELCQKLIGYVISVYSVYCRQAQIFPFFSEDFPWFGRKRRTPYHNLELCVSFYVSNQWMYKITIFWGKYFANLQTWVTNTLLPYLYFQINFKYRLHMSGKFCICTRCSCFQ